MNQFTIPAAMLKAATDQLQHAYCPYSNYPVAACVSAEDGTLFTAANVENAAYNCCSCAETNAICQLVSAGYRTLQSCLVLSPDPTLTPPCGACRQRLGEFATDHMAIYLCSTNGDFQIHYLHDLLPNAFGPTHLETS